MGLRHAAPLALIAALGATASAQPPVPTPQHALAAARTYLSAWQGTLTNLVADESYRQELSQYRGGVAGGAKRSRRLRSEVLLVRAPAENVWLSFRDVIEVDGAAVGDRKTRFETLFSGPTAMLLSTAERIAEESARFNLGRMVRTINTPTAGLVFLHPEYEANTKWMLDPNERLDGQRVWELRFDQREQPFAVRIPAGSSPRAFGKFNLDPASGRIVEWELGILSGRSRARVKVRYGEAPGVREGWVPLRLEEEYEVPRIERFWGEAAYSNHRLFRTSGRVIG